MKFLTPALVLTVSLTFALPQYSHAAQATGLSFENLELPETDEGKVSFRVTNRAYVSYSDGTTKEFPIFYRTLARTGDKDPFGNIFGLRHDREGKIIQTSLTPTWISTYPDANSAFKRNNRYYLLTHFETYPGGAYLTELHKTEADTFLSVKFRDIDFSNVNGTVLNCAGSKTPWDTHLGGEEDYNFDAFYFDLSTSDYSPTHILNCDEEKQGFFCESLEGMRRYLKVDSPSDLNPYDYGYVVEVSLDNEAWPDIRKHYAMGKSTPELGLVMPDLRTVYITDDGSYSGFYMFVADKEKDLSAGTLYMAKWVQKSAENGGRAELNWIRLGQASDKEIKKIIEKRPFFSDIFDSEAPENCPKGFRLIRAGGTGLMCLRLKDGRGGSALSERFADADEALKAAAFLETRKYGSYLGATTEFSKEEGLAYDAERNIVYVAMSSIERSMEQSQKDPADHIKLPKNRCGAIYAVKFGEAADEQGKPIKSKFAGIEMAAVVSGRPLKTGQEFSEDFGCHPDSIANPDNIAILKNILFIGEDSSFHLNNMVWAYDMVKGSLTRIMTLPTGAESTGSFHRLEAEDKLYIFTNIQHPFEEITRNAAGKPTNQRFINSATEEQRRGSVGYVMGLPSLSPKSILKLGDREK